METSSALKHIIDINNNKNNIKIKIRLSDDCKNGHNDFEMTATVWEPNKPRADRNMISDGCCHNEILKVRKDLKIFADLHLSDAQGAPMYAIGNGFYHFVNSSAEVAKEYLRISEEEFNKLLPAKSDNDYFKYLVQSLGVPGRWKEEANAAIAILEDWTGLKFQDDSVKRNWPEVTPEFLKAVEDKIKAGYYQPAV